MKTATTESEFIAKSVALAAALGGMFESDDFSRNSGKITQAAPFTIYVSLGYNQRLHIAADLRLKDSEGETMLAREYAPFGTVISKDCTADFNRPTEAISRQIRRMTDSVMPHWRRLVKARDDRLEMNQRTKKTLDEIKVLLADLIHSERENGFYVRGSCGFVSALSEKVVIDLHTLSLSPERAAKVIRILNEEC